MKIKTKKIELETKKQIEFADVTETVADFVESSKIKNGQVTVFSSHTTASVIINHNEQMLIQDITRILYKIAPVDERYDHDVFELTHKNESDGRSNGHSHCKNMILGNSETIPVENGEMMLGQRQSIFFVEFDGARERDFVIQIIGE